VVKWSTLWCRWCRPYGQSLASHVIIRRAMKQPRHNALAILVIPWVRQNFFITLIPGDFSYRRKELFPKWWEALKLAGRCWSRDTCTFFSSWWRNEISFHQMKLMFEHRQLHTGWFCSLLTCFWRDRVSTYSCCNGNALLAIAFILTSLSSPV
jgi:hypothetical protein